MSYIYDPAVDVFKTLGASRRVDSMMEVLDREFPCPSNARRIWRVTGVYAPTPQYRIGGIRLRIEDQKKVASFINQRDAEVLLGLAKPGTFCQWHGGTYAKPGDPTWVGPTVTADDLADIVLDLETWARYSSHTRGQGLSIQSGRQFAVLLYDGDTDQKQTWRFIGDATPLDFSLEGLAHRWQKDRSEKQAWSEISA